MNLTTMMLIQILNHEIRMSMTTLPQLATKRVVPWKYRENKVCVGALYPRSTSTKKKLHMPSVDDS
jgi:hypothetical protein